MAILRGGLYGNISGKIGGLVFSTRNNQTEVRNLPKKYEGPVTEAALNVRARLKLLIEFLRLFTYFIRIGFPKKRKQRMTAFNVAFSENHRFIINGAYPHLEIDYSKVILSKGYLDGLGGLKIDRIDRHSFEMKWEINIKWYQFPESNGCDRIYCILYDAIDKHVAEVSLGAMRNDTYFPFFLPEEMMGKKLHVYVFLCSSTKRAVSGTQYQCLDLRDPDPNERERNLSALCNAAACERANAKREALRKVTKHLVIPKKYCPEREARKDSEVRS